LVRWILAFLAALAFWQRSCFGRHHIPIRHPQGYWKCRRCGRTEVHVGAYLDMDPELDGYVNPHNLVAFDKRKSS
jgi:hypothetical protein